MAELLQHIDPNLIRTEQRRAKNSFAILITLVLHLSILLVLLIPILNFYPSQDDTVEIEISLFNPGELVTEQQLLEEDLSATNNSDLGESGESGGSEIITTSQSKTSSREPVLIADKPSPIVKSNNASHSVSKEEIEEANRKKQEQAEKLKQQEAYEKAKQKYGNAFGDKSGNGESGQGTGSGTQGDGTARLKKIGAGTAEIGEGLSNRTVLASPKIKDDSQVAGKISIKICVNADGKVTSAEYTQRGSTSSNAHLIQLATRNVLSYIFSKSEHSLQCGNVLFDFKLN